MTQIIISMKQKQTHREKIEFVVTRREVVGVREELGAWD